MTFLYYIAINKRLLGVLTAVVLTLKWKETDSMNAFK